MKNHLRVNGQLLQTNKKYSALKQKQKEQINQWLKVETEAYYLLHQRYRSIPNQKIDEGSD